MISKVIRFRLCAGVQRAGVRAHGCEVEVRELDPLAAVQDQRQGSQARS
jgi:hypothetical protein